MDWMCYQNTIAVHLKTGHVLESRKKKREGTTEGEVEEMRATRTEGFLVELNQPYVQTCTERIK